MKTTDNLFRIFLFAAILLVSAASSLRAQQSREVFTLTGNDLQSDKQIALDKLQWKYHAGDDANWANPGFDDSSWETLNGTILTLDKLPKSGWNGIGWFRFHFKVDESLTNQQLALIMDHWGASEIYVDGKLINRFGKVGATVETEEAFRPNKIPVFFGFDANQGEHLIAVRHSVMLLRDANSLQSRILSNRLGIFGNSKNAVGLQISLREAENAALDYEYALRIEVGNRFGRGALILMIGLLFLMLYLFYPRRRANLYFSVCAIFVVLNLMSVFVRESTHQDLPLVAVCAFLSVLSWAAELIFLLIFLYTAFHKSIPKYFWFYVAAYSVYISANPFLTTAGIDSLIIIALYSFALIESIRIVVKAIIEKQPGAWIVGIGITMFGVLILQNVILAGFLLFSFQTPFPAWFVFYSRQFSTLGLTIPIAIYLAQQFAQTNKTLEAQLIKEVEHERAANQLALEREQEKARFALVEAENERRAKELEEARQLQLSMLPKKLPIIPNLEIAAYMKPATEVGGDYYDFHVSPDGTLTVAVGDATGHGLKAGSVVTATKSLFNAFAKQNDISQILKEISRALKQMNLRGLFMAMTLLKIKDDQVSLSIAGMPSALVYRREINQVEEISIRAMPLGSIAKTSYQEQQITLAKEDVVVLMSDGFPEMFNNANEMLGFDKAAEILPNIAAHSAQEIINELVKTGEDWASGRPQDDDVTFVVLKVKTDAGA